MKNKNKKRVMTQAKHAIEQIQRHKLQVRRILVELEDVIDKHPCKIDTDISDLIFAMIGVVKHEDIFEQKILAGVLNKFRLKN